MSREKQINEMARIIGHCKSTIHPDIECHNKATGCYCIENPCHNQRISDKLYNAGYRKQSEGEWTRVEVNGKNYGQVYYQHKDCEVNETQLFPSPYNFCPNCGAKMKGGAEE